MKYFNALLLLLALGLGLTLSSADAALDLELTQGIDAALPIAILAFTHDLSGDESVAQVIKQDLQNSGEFRIKTSQFIETQPARLAQVDTQYWRKQGVDDVLIGQVQPLVGQRYRVSFQLLSTVNASTNPKPKVVTLLNQSYDTTQQGLRQLAHHISDVIYQKLTSVRGVFSTKVAYVLVQHHHQQARQYALEVADIDGFNPQPLLTSTQPIMSPAWSPDGKKLAYVSFEGHHASIYLQDLVTGQRQLVSDHPGINGAPAFSPDGKQLAMVLTLTGNPKIYTYDLDSKKLTCLTKGSSIDTEPAWALDSQSIVFTSNRGGNPQVYRYYFKNAQIDRVTFDGNYNACASFVPEQNSIVVMHRDTGLFGIARQDLTSSQVDILAQTGADESPSVSPNGRMIVYATEYGGRGVLALVSTDGRIKLRLPAREGDVREPAWSPFLS